MQNTHQQFNTSLWRRVQAAEGLIEIAAASKSRTRGCKTTAMAAAGGDDVPILQAENLSSNVKSVHYSRTFLSIIGGVAAGIWGFTGLMGFVFYFVIMMVASIGLLAKSKFSVQTYFDSWSRISIEGVFGGLMSFVLFWTFAYDIVHIF